MKTGVILFGNVILLFFASCAPSSLSPEKYKSWVESESHGLKVKKDVGDFTFTFQFKPLPYIALIESRDLNVKETFIQKRTNEMAGMQYFTLTITSKDRKEILASHAASESEYYDRLQYLVADAQNDISLIQGKDTLPCKLYHFERDYGISPNAKLLLGFESAKGDQEKENKVLLFDEKILGGGRIFMAINASDINKLPQLKLNGI